jgi:hypothetical protein
MSAMIGRQSNTSGRVLHRVPPCLAVRQKSPRENYPISTVRNCKPMYGLPTSNGFAPLAAGAADDSAWIRMVALPLCFEYMHTRDRMATMSDRQYSNMRASLQTAESTGRRPVLCNELFPDHAVLQRNAPIAVWGQSFTRD